MKPVQPGSLAPSDQISIQLPTSQQSTVNNNVNNLNFIEDIQPICLSNSTFKFLSAGGNHLDYGLFNPEYSNVTFKNCNTLADFKAVEDLLTNLMSCQSFSPDHCFSPLTLMCYIVNPRTYRRKKIRIVYDNCSNITVLDEQTAADLDLEGEDVDISFAGTGGTKQRFGNQKDVKFILQSLDGKFTTQLIQAATMPKVMLGFDRITINPSDYDYLSDIKDFTEHFPMKSNQFKKHGTVKLLLGLPYEHHYGPRKRTTGKSLSEPVAIHTPLGSGISVPLKNYQRSSQSTLNVGKGAFEVDENGEIICVKNQSNQIYPDITQFMSLDLLGIKD